MADRRGALATMSLTSRVAIGVSALLLIGGVVVSLAAFAYGRQAAQDAYDRLLLGAANDIATSITISNGAPTVVLPVSAFELLALAPDDRIGYRVVGVNGETLTGYEELALPSDRKAAVATFFDGDFFGEAARFVVVSRRFAERTLNGTVQVIVGHTLLARNTLAFDITRKALYVLAASGIAMLLLAAIVVRSALKPLERIAEGLSKRDPYDLTPMDSNVPREVSVMVTAVNGFMGRLDRQMISMRHLISDTAHQLRTPVAALRAQADLLVEEQDDRSRLRIVQRLHDRSVTLGRLLDQLLSRALVTHRVDSVKRERLDLRDVVLDVYEADDHGLLAPAAEVRLHLGDEPAWALGDGPSIGEALKNLLGNALKYGKAPIILGAGLENGQATVWVHDSGPGPDPSVLDQVGERFNRAAVNSGGSGLGLAIAQAVCEAYEGQLVFSRPQKGGFRVTLAFETVGGNQL